MTVPPSGSTRSGAGPTSAALVPPPLENRLADAPRYAALHGLAPVGTRPPLRTYVRDLWAKRAFIRVLATSKAYAENQTTYLGQLWTILNPLLNAIVYIAIFGFLMGTRAGTENVIAFIVVGTFIFRFFDASVGAGSRSITGNASLVRSLRFPRAVLPVAGVLAQLATLLPALVVMCVVVLVSQLVPGMGPVPLGWRWLLLAPAVGLLWVFSTGCAFIAGRLVAVAPDVANVIPFVMRFVMYGSGVIFSIDSYVSAESSPALHAILTYQPVAVYLDLARSAILNEPSITIDPVTWIVGAGWALVALVGGFTYFWRGEERYGRD